MLNDINKKLSHLALKLGISLQEIDYPLLLECKEGREGVCSHLASRKTRHQSVIDLATARKNLIHIRLLDL